MPSKTKKQRKLMAAAAHDKDFARKAGVDPKVAKEFNQADAARGKKGLSSLMRKGKRKK